MISTRWSWPLRVGVLAFCLSSSVASAGLTLDGSLQLSSRLSLSEQKNYSEDMARAEKAFNSEDVVKAIKILRGTAEKNHLPAQVRLGELLDYAEEDEEAVGWYMMAANQGYAPGEYNLGGMYAIGEGIAVELEKAVYWIRKSADQDYLAAVKSLAHSYRTGDMGLEIDLEQARHWESKIPSLEEAYKKSVLGKVKNTDTKTETEKGKKK